MTDAKPYRLLSPDRVMERAEVCVKVAREYFGVSAEWEVDLLPERDIDDHATASNEIDPTYLTSSIRLDLRHLGIVPSLIWETIGHEVAHLVTAEYALPVGMVDEKQREGLKDLFKFADERAVVRLTRMFLRDRPDPYPAATAPKATFE